jgi:hypothetical protein
MTLKQDDIARLQREVGATRDLGLRPSEGWLATRLDRYNKLYDRGGVKVWRAWKHRPAILCKVGDRWYESERA